MRNPYLCLTIVLVLGAGGILGLAGIILIAYAGHDVPQALIAIVSAAFGSLASFLVMPPRGSVGIDPPPGDH